MTGDSGSIRQAILQRCRALSPGERAQLSTAVAQRFLARAAFGIGGAQPAPPAWARPLPASWSGARVGLFRALETECELREIEHWLEGQGALVHYPRVLDRAAGRMEFAYAPPSAARWSAGPYGNEEPDEGCPAVGATELDVIFVPGVAFGEGGERIGRGKGFYDRYLAQAARALRISLAFDIQVVANLPQSPWDQKVHWILTEKREIYAADGRSVTAKR